MSYRCSQNVCYDRVARRCAIILTRRSSHRRLAAAAAQTETSHAVSANETFQAAMTNMPTESCDVLVGFGGRWERWLPPAANAAAVVQQNPEATGVTGSSVQAQGWQLISSGQSVYCFRPGAPPGENVDSALTVHVMEAPDRCPTTLEAARCHDDSASSQGEVHADIHRSTNRFTVDDVFFKPHLPESSSSGPSGGSTNPVLGLRLWAANHHGFAMAPVALPAASLNPPVSSSSSSGSGSDVDGSSNSAPGMPFIANLYVKHPSSEPGVGCRWGWNIQYEPSGTGTLDHIHHTSLQLLALQAAAVDGQVEQQLQPGLFPPPTPETWGTEGPAASGIDRFMAQRHEALEGSAVEFFYDAKGDLQRRMVESCAWTPSSSSSGGSSSSAVVEVWYSSGGYTKSPRSIQACVSAGEAVVLEGGAVFRHRDEITRQPSLRATRWVLQYRPGDGQLQKARLETYVQLQQ